MSKDEMEMLIIHGKMLDWSFLNEGKRIKRGAGCKIDCIGSKIETEGDLSSSVDHKSSSRVHECEREVIESNVTSLAIDLLNGERVHTPFVLRT